MHTATKGYFTKAKTDNARFCAFDSVIFCGERYFRMITLFPTQSDSAKTTPVTNGQTAQPKRYPSRILTMTNPMIAVVTATGRSGLPLSELSVIAWMA
jgi:hypothetical protein